ncbi:MAG: MCE family protein [Chitinophagaceae bacterium]|nr:MAG: MCE family protein [Chitinophagaceae bacterium]
MKISNETKVGILMISALTLLVIGYNFLKGNDIFQKEKQLYAVFGDLGSLKKSNDIRINGLPIGAVYNYTEIDKDLSGIIVTIKLHRDINIPNNSIATIESELLGTSFINISKGDSKQFLQNGDTLVTDRASSILNDVKAQLNPMFGKMRETLEALTITLSNINSVFTVENKDNIHQAINSIKESSASLSQLLDVEKGSLAQTLNNTASITENFKNNNDSVTAAISAIKKTADKLYELQLQQTIDSTKATIVVLKKILEKANSNDNTLGVLLNDKKLYLKLNDALLSAEILLDDLRAHPKRYVNISIFGRKDKTTALHSPLKKDSTPQ